MTKKIFISYAHDDNKYLTRVEKILCEHGIIEGEAYSIIDPLKESISSGQDIRALLKTQIQSASVVVVIATEKSAQSQWVNYEVGLADALGKPIIVVGSRRSEKTSFLSNLSKFQYLVEENLCEQLTDDEIKLKYNLSYDFSTEMIQAIARREGLELTDDHWEVIQFMKDFCNKYQVAPMVKILIKEIKKTTGHDVNKLFPDGGIEQVNRLFIRSKATEKLTMPLETKKPNNSLE